MRQVFPTLERAREVSHPKPADPWGFSREAQDHGYRSHVSVSLGLRLLADYLAAHTIVLLGLAPSVFPIDTLLSGEFHNKKKRLAAKTDGLPLLSITGLSHPGYCLCVLWMCGWRCWQGRHFSSASLPPPYQIICGNVCWLEGQSVQTGHLSCLCGMCPSELISQPAFVDKKYYV